jgi:ACR3 family arsenite efflux pump ArsB
MLFMGYSPLLGLGFIMLLVTPCTDWYLVFTGMAKGNLNLSISILPVNLLLQMILLPVYILIFSGKAVDINMFLVGKSMLLTLIIPFALAKLLKLLFAKYHADTGLLENLIIKRQFFWLWLSITMMFASEKIIGEGYLMIFLIILIPTTLFFLVNFYLGRFVSNQMGFSKENSVSLIFTTLARNSPLSLAFAQLAFPADRQVLLPLIIGPLIELPILALMAQAILVVFNDQGKKTRKEY